MQPGVTPPSAASFVADTPRGDGIQALLGCVQWGFCNGTQGPDSPTPLPRERRLQDQELILRELLKGSTTALISPSTW